MSSFKAIFFLYSSAGELDWVLPIIKKLINSNTPIQIIYLSNGVRENIKLNKFLNEFLKSHSEIKVCTLGWFSRRARRIGEKLHIKYSASINKHFFKFFDNLLKYVYIKNICLNLSFDDLKKKNMIFLEFRNLSKHSNLRKWHESIFTNSNFYYFPHAAGVHMNVGPGSYPTLKKGSSSNKFILLGHPNDLDFVKSDYVIDGYEPLYIGHPKYSKEWISYLKSDSGYSSDKNLTKILIISRGVDYHLDKETQKTLIDSTVKVISSKFKKYQIIVKKHPRGEDDYWDHLSISNNKITFSNDHIFLLAQQAKFAIAFWSSASIDCFVMGTPCIDFMYPKKLKLDFDIGLMFRQLGVALPANNEEELSRQIDRVISEDVDLDIGTCNQYFQDLIARSNQWYVFFEKSH